MPAKSAADVAKAMLSMLWKYRRHVRTITAENGSEFYDHEIVAEKLKANIYFTYPYSSWDVDSMKTSTVCCTREHKKYENKWMKRYFSFNQFNIIATFESG
ncbi:hypothetical protein [Alteromonas macleodii]|uniref:hypothetical protein n=1 Tax=Alteromonas macleodii TaxID=28108 RepID=UPI001E5A7ECD|nr:hypothetical protein [Alteromonas macleodii]